jgi:hypothetical protein
MLPYPERGFDELFGEPVVNGSCRDFLHQVGTTGGAATESVAKTLGTKHLAAHVMPVGKAPRAVFRPNG